LQLSRVEDYLPTEQSANLADNQVSLDLHPEGYARTIHVVQIYLRYKHKAGVVIDM
jgi:hypothetical protein